MGQRLILSEQEKKNIQEMYGLISEQGDKEGYLDKSFEDLKRSNGLNAYRLSGESLDSPEQYGYKNSSLDTNMRKDFGSVENMASDKITINGQTMPLQKLKTNVRTSKSGRESSNLGPVKVGSDLIFIGTLLPKEIKTGDVSNVGEFSKMNGNALNRAMQTFFFWFETEGTNNKYRYDSEQWAKAKESQGVSPMTDWLGPKQKVRSYFELAGNPVWDKNKLATNYEQSVIFPFKIIGGAEKLRDKLIQWDFTTPGGRADVWDPEEENFHKMVNKSN